ncbi:MAG TPA: amidohydrolase [Candidatus Cybelea sp.]|nr:amidohydrolase [Candidatus Cybelea sp.]
MTASRSDDAADLIFIGGAIHTADDRFPAPHAFAVRGDRFSYVGDAEGAMAQRGPETQIVDASGLTIYPGFVDAHLHLTNLGFKLDQAVLDGARSEEEVVARTEAFAETTDDPWILGRGWDQNLWPDAKFPSHQLLSTALDDRPVALARVDGHALLANARAMALAQVDEATPDPPGGQMVRDARGNPTGLFIDAAQELIYGVVPKPTQERLVRAIRAGIAECNRWGITAVAEPGCSAAMLAAHRALLESGEYSIRNYAMLDDDDALIAAHAGDGSVEAAYNGRLWIRAIKMYADGALGSRGAALLEAYADDPGNLGLILTPQRRIESVTQAGLRSGFQVCVHAIGDRANRMVLDAFERALPRGGDTGARLRIEHVQVISAEDILRLADLGIIASMQASHALSDIPWVPARLGSRRIARAYAWRPILDAGVILANGTDAPVEPASTARTFAASISQHGPVDQRMTRREALASMTISAAYANFQEALIGSISPGKYADFVVMDRDWMSCAPEEIAATEILSTYFGGRRVYGEPLGSIARFS